MCCAHSVRGPSGFTLVEVLVSLAILITVLVGVAHLLAVAIDRNLESRADTEATVLASQKLEELMAAPALEPSPPDTLVRDTPGYTDRPGGGYTRRWIIQPSPADPDNLLVIHVIARGPGGETPPGASPIAVGLPARGEVRLFAIRRRRRA